MLYLCLCFFDPMQMRNPKEVEKEQYHEFYKNTFNEFLDPLTYTHFTTEVSPVLMLHDYTGCGNY